MPLLFTSIQKEMADKQKKEKFISAIGRAIWPHVHAPDKKFKKEYGEYRTKLALTEEEAQPIIDKIDVAVKEIFAEAKAAFKADVKNKGKTFENTKQGKIMDTPYVVGEGDDAGTVIFNFKTPAGGLRKDKTEWTRQLAVFDAKGKPLPANTRVGSGSRIKVAYTFNPFSTPLGTGMSLRLEAVQVIELKEFERDAKSFGFGEEEGFSVNEGTEPTAETTEETVEEGAETKGGADF